MSPPVRLIAAPLFDPGAGRVDIELPAGLTIAEMVALSLPDLPAEERQRVRVALVTSRGSQIILPELWARARPRPGVQVLIRVVPGKNALRSVLMIAVTVASIAMGNIWGVQLAGAIGVSQQVGVALVTAGLNIVGSLLANALVPPPQPDEDKRRDRFTITGWRNRYDPGGAVPFVLGTHRYAPPFAATSWSEVVGDWHYVRAAFTFGYGRVQLSDFRLGETSISEYDEVEIEVRDGVAGNAPISLYPRQVIEESISAELTRPMPRDDAGNIIDDDVSIETPVVRTTADDAERVSIILTWPAGLIYVDDDGDKRTEEVRIRIEQRRVDAANWSLVETLTVRARKAEAFYRQHSWTLPSRGRYQIRLTMLTEEPANLGRTRRTVWVALQSIRPEYPFNMPGQALVALRIKATHQLSGQLDDFSAVAQRACLDYDRTSGTWIDRVTSNPASLFRHVLQSPANPRRVGNAGIDLALLEDWHEFCRVNDLRYDRVLDERAAREAADNAIRAAARDGLILPLVNVAGTGDAITADLSSTLIAAGITTLSSLAELDYVPIATNAAANPTITVAGMTLGIRDTGGGDWPAGGFRVGYIYKLRRRGMTARVSGGVSYREILDLGTRLSGQEARWTDRTVQIAAIDPAGYAVPGGTARIITEGGGWLSVWRVSDNQTAPESDTRKRTTDGKVWARISRAPLEETVAPTMSAVSEVATPALRRSTDAQFRVHEVTDLGGGLHLPGLNGLSVQEHVARINDRLTRMAALTPYQTVVNAVSDLGCDPTGVEPCEGIINEAIKKLTASVSGPATIFYPRGTYKLTERIWPKSRVSHIGSGRDQVVFLPYGTKAAFAFSGSPADYLENCIFSHFSVNGENQTLTNGAYSVATKGAFFQGFRLCLFTDLRFMDTGATSLGIDFASQSIIQRLLVERGGRLAQRGDFGASGIGIGTGWQQSEPLIIADSISLDCRNYGVFVERQKSDDVHFDARHNIFSGLICRGNGHAFGEAGCAGSIVSGSQFTDSFGSGVALHSGTLNNGPHPGVRTLLRDSVIERNGGAGVEFDGTKTFGPRGYSSDGNRLEGNAGPAHWIRGGNGTVDDLAIRGDEIIGNGGHGIHVESGTFTNLDIIGPRLLRNTGDAIRLDASITGGRIDGATIRDLQPTKTQTGSISGAGALTDFDIDGVHGVGCAPINLTGTLTRVTFGRNPGV